MKETSITKEFTFINDHYKVTKYHGSEVLEIELFSKDSIWNDGSYKRIYFGHLEPLEEIIKFFKENPNPLS